MSGGIDLDDDVPYDDERERFWDGMGEESQVPPDEGV